MADGKGGALATIVVALIGTAGVLGAALISSGRLTLRQGSSAPAPIPDDTAPLPPTPRADFATARPQLLAPSAGEVLDTAGRHTLFTWLPLAQAVRYKLEVQYCDMNAANCIAYPDQVVPETQGSVDFIGAQPGRWRVTAYDANNAPSRASAWSGFSYSQ